jgi:hypothetical protein
MKNVLTFQCEDGDAVFPALCQPPRVGGIRQANAGYCSQMKANVGIFGKKRLFNSCFGGGHGAHACGTTPYHSKSVPAAPKSRFSDEGESSLLKVIKGYSRLLKPFFKNPFFMALQPEPFNLQLSTPHSGHLCQSM